jgi:hypothetical protein
MTPEQINRQGAKNVTKWNESPFLVLGVLGG